MTESDHPDSDPRSEEMTQQDDDADRAEANTELAEPRPIVGAVARILNSRELVINRGSDHGVRLGMYFDVLAPEGEDIQDPETHEILGSVDRPKVSVQVIDVQPRMAIASTYRTRSRNLGGQSFASAEIANLFAPPRWVTTRETLKTSEDTWENLSERESYVNTGDPVKESARQPDED